MGFPLPIPAELHAAFPRRTSVLVALSGGVDSGVTLALLAELGCELLAVTFKNFCYGDDESVPARACCSLQSIADARKIARQYGVTHQVVDLSDRFRQGVIDPFVQEYQAGRTPNPCLTCNSRVRFPALVRLADQLGLDKVATGHYARLEPGREGVFLRRGIDPEKDQAYFLHGIDRALFGRLVFPLGWYRKTEVRQAARRLGLPVAEKPDSQEICFVPDRDRSFLFADGDATAAGDIVTPAGQVLGRHRGLVHYTVGQRRGLGVSVGEPLYVLAIDRPRNRLVVGPERGLAVRRILCDCFTAAVADFPAAGPPGGSSGSHLARIRHRHRGVPVARWSLTSDRLAVDLAEPASGVAPGQALVLYRDDLVLGGGRIFDTR